MIFREATINDIPQIQTVRNSVKENSLSDPALVSDKDCEEFMTLRGKGWVCEIDKHIVGFAIADLKDHNIWALFLHPDYEKRGIGRRLHQMMLDWYFTQTTETVWLGTAPGTRAEMFYTKAGWTPVGMHGTREVKFEMTHANWKQLRESSRALTSVKMLNYSIPAIACYLIIKISVLIGIGMQVTFPPSFLASIGIATNLLYIFAYLSLIPILVHFNEKKWHIIILSIFIFFTGTDILAFVAIGLLNQDIDTTWLAGIVSSLTSLTLAISYFYIKEKRISGFFKLFAIALIVSLIIPVVLPVFISYPHLIFANSLIRLLPIATILLINIRVKRILRVEKSLKKNH